MPTYSYGPTVEARAIRLLRALLLFANWEVENPDHFNIRFSWSNKYSSHPKLMLKTNLIALEYLVSKDGHKGVALMWDDIDFLSKAIASKSYPSFEPKLFEQCFDI